jgi:DNA-binding response OmpR family regulator
VTSEAANTKVLVVEDEPSMRFLCRVNLEMTGFEVLEAATGQEALDHVDAPGLELVLLDVMLPDIGGHEVARVLHEKTAPAFAFISARASRDDLRTGFELGAVDYITKPFDPVALADRVREILRRIENGEAERFRLARLAELSE